MKLWKQLRGYKRQAGAVMVVIPVLLQAFGVESEQVGHWLKVVETLGVLVFGIGWVDRAAVEVKGRIGVK